MPVIVGGTLPRWIVKRMASCLCSHRIFGKDTTNRLRHGASNVVLDSKDYHTAHPQKKQTAGKRENYHGKKVKSLQNSILFWSHPWYFEGCSTSLLLWKLLLSGMSRFHLRPALFLFRPRAAGRLLLLLLLLCHFPLALLERIL